MSPNEVSDDTVETLYLRLRREAEEGGYHLNPDADFVRELVRSLQINERRYGYWACPCRLASGSTEDDLDIVCPCDYRDADIGEYGSCYCALYVSDEIAAGRKAAGSIPERRLPEGEREKARKAARVSREAGGGLPLPVWRCKVCGYLCARAGPPDSCPVCKAGKDRFEEFVAAGAGMASAMPVWRCRVCGYLCAREAPPEVCPVCKAKKDRFERFL